MLAEAQRSDACTGEGDRTAADWVARTTRQRRPHARADLALAEAVHGAGSLRRSPCDRLEGHAQVAAALAAGRVNLDQARTITRALADLPTTGPEALTAEQLVSAEAFLVEHDAYHDARDLAVLGKRLHEVVAPDEAETREGRALEAEERAAARRLFFEMRDHPDGTCHGRSRISRLHGSMLHRTLLALMSPARQAAPLPVPPDETTSTSPVELVETTPLPPSELVGTTPPSPVEPVETTPLPPSELIETMSRHDLPTMGGGDATVVVTMTLEQLLADLSTAGVATLDTGHRISAAEARRLAAHHRLVPMVLGIKGQVLDQGMGQRLFTKAQRLALAQQQGGCTAQHCDAPPALCHAHHDHPWSAGGPTDLANGRLLCGHHHRRLHDRTYISQPLPTGRIAYHCRE